MKIGIYYIKNLSNNKYYIGQSINIDKRINRHINELRKNKHSNKHLQSSYNKYGEKNFKFDIILCCKERYLDRLEKLYIKKFDSLKNGYNQNIGGGSMRGYRHTEEQKEKMSYQRKGNNHIYYGKHRSNDVRKKISNTLMGNTLSVQTKNKISKGVSQTKNTSGYYRVSMEKTKRVNQGFFWKYCYMENGKRKSISSVDINKLEEKVKDNKLPWEKF